MWQWWTFCDKFPRYLKKVQYMYRMLVSKSCLKADIKAFKGESGTCNLCDNHALETCAHMLFDCEGLNELRTQLWHDVGLCIPKPLFQDINKMSSILKVEFIFSAFRSPYVKEWSFVYMSIADFCYKMYRRRQDSEMEVI